MIYFIHDGVYFCTHAHVQLYSCLYTHMCCIFSLLFFCTRNNNDNFEVYGDHGRGGRGKEWPAKVFFTTASNAGNSNSSSFPIQMPMIHPNSLSVNSTPKPMKPSRNSSSSTPPPSSSSNLRNISLFDMPSSIMA